MARNGYSSERPELWRRVNMRLGWLGLSMVDLLETMHPKLADKRARSVARTYLHEILNGLRPLHPDYLARIAEALSVEVESLADGAPWTGWPTSPPWVRRTARVTNRREKPKTTAAA